jgi:dynactin 1
MEQHVKGVVIGAAVSESIVCEGLTERNMSMQEKLDSLRVTIKDLKNLKELNDELETDRIEVVNQL